MCGFGDEEPPVLTYRHCNSGTADASLREKRKKTFSHIISLRVLLFFCPDSHATAEGNCTNKLCGEDLRQAAPATIHNS